MASVEDEPAYGRSSRLARNGPQHSQEVIRAAEFDPVEHLDKPPAPGSRVRRREVSGRLARRDRRATGNLDREIRVGQQRRESNDLVESLDRPSHALETDGPTQPRRARQRARSGAQPIGCATRIGARQAAHRASCPGHRAARLHLYQLPIGTNQADDEPADRHLKPVTCPRQQRLGTPNFAAVATSSGARLLPLDSKEQPVRRLATSAFVPEPHSGLASSGCVRSALRWTEKPSAHRAPSLRSALGKSCS